MELAPLLATAEQLAEYGITSERLDEALRRGELAQAGVFWAAPGVPGVSLFPVREALALAVRTAA